ncbi:Hypothetical protein SCF082_LOCUS3177 [Durusdinium trenchii]|uniref:Uncharacterized protein n=1 Tax=Durusdinium trenchii TaxID=1381693 RepID=A0ABP0HR30_9DINO
MDLAELMGGGGGNDLTGTLTAMTNAGDLVFKQPFGDTTIWKTDKGLLRVTVLFDPFLPWNRANMMASTSPDFLGEIKRLLTKHLVPDKLAPEMPTRQEVLFSKMRTMLPDRAFSEYLLQKNMGGKKKMDEFVGMLEKSIGEQLDEEEALMEAIKNKEFQFTYHLAIDSYPQEKSSTKTGSSRSVLSDNPFTKTEKLGVLVFTMAGLPDPVEAEEQEVKESSMAKIGIDTAPAEEVAKPPTPPTGVDAKASLPTLRNHRNPKSNRAQMDLEALLVKLNISADKLEQGHNEWIKHIPLTSHELFEQINGWFSALLERKQTQFADEQGGGTSSSIYR